MRRLISLGLAASVGLGAGYALAQRPNAAGGPVSFADVVRRHPIDPETGAAVTPILAGEFASVNVWQLTKQIPPHLHRTHEEVIIVQSGTAMMRVGEREFPLKAGDVLIVPKNTVHGARATGDEPFRGFSVFGPAFDGRDRVFVEEMP